MSFFSSYRDYFTILKTLFVPDQVVPTIEDIDLDALSEAGYRYFLVDVDNTVLPMDDKTLTLQRFNWIKRVKDKGFDFYFVSNNSSAKRIRKVCDQVQVQGMYFSCKPFSYHVKDFAKRNMIDLKASVFVGDQLFTDVLVGNWCQGYSVLVDPLDQRLSFFKTVQRKVELFLLTQLA